MSSRNNFKPKDLGFFDNIIGIQIPKRFPRMAALIYIILFLTICFMFVPWQQTSSALGEVTALDPTHRVQEIVAPVSGRVVKWYARDGSYVHAGESIVELADIDPERVSRLSADAATVDVRYNAAIKSAELSKRNYERQKSLYEQGLTSRKDYEYAEINYQKAKTDVEYYNSLLIKAKASIATQSNQLIRASASGYVVNTLASSDYKIVKSGQKLATFLPDTKEVAVELLVDGNDIPLVELGDHVRLVFAGWPAIQFSGWPSVSIGTFGGKIKVIDYAANNKGYFRVLVVQDSAEKPWPNKNFIRMGTQVHGYIQLNQVALGFELWRKLNGFPVSVGNSKIDKLYSLDEYEGSEKSGEKTNDK